MRSIFKRKKTRSDTRRIVGAVVMIAVGMGAFWIAAAGLRFCYLSVVGDSYFGGPEFSVQRVARMIQGDVPFPESRLLILGDSTAAMSIDAKRLGAHSLATVYGTPIDGYRTVKALLENGKAPTCVVLAYSFQWDSSHREMFWSLYLPLQFYDKASLQEFYDVAVKSGSLSALLPRWLFQFGTEAASLGAFRGPGFFFLQRALMNQLWRKRYLEEFRERLYQNNGSHLLASRGLFEGAVRSPLREPPSMQGAEAEYLRRMVGLMNDHGVQVFFTELPFPPAVSSEAVGTYWQNYEGLLKNVLRGLRYELLRLPPVPEEEFITFGHLTARGASLASEQILRTLPEGCTTQ